MLKSVAHTFAVTLLLAALGPADAVAQHMGSSHVGAATRASELSGTAKPHNNASPFRRRKVEDSTRSAPMSDAAAVAKVYSAVSRSREGKQSVAPASEALRKAVEAGLAEPQSSAEGVKRKAADPAPAGDEMERQIFGADDRVQINRTTAYPFSAIGYLEMKFKSGNYGSCSAALIGPRTVLTAAQCLYNHEDGGWLDEFVFFPAIGSFENTPYGGFAYDTVTITQGYIDNYKTAYADVLPYDLGIVTLQEPIGDTLGWLGYANYDDLSDFTANLVGYPSDKPAGTMWRSTCDVLSENIEQDIFTYKCDTAIGTGGGAVYNYNEATKERTVLGIDVAENATYNVAVRLNAVNVEFINGQWK